MTEKLLKNNPHLWLSEAGVVNKLYGLGCYLVWSASQHLHLPLSINRSGFDQPVMLSNSFLLIVA